MKRADIESMKDAEAKEYLLDHASNARERAARIVIAMPGVPFQGALMLDLLYSKSPWIATYDQLSEHIEDQTDRTPDSLNLQTTMKHLRRAVRSSGYPMTIRTHNALGYSLEIPDGWHAPWDEA